MSRILSPVVRWLLTLAVGLLVLIALAVTTVRLGLPLADQMRDDLALRLSQQLGYPVSIERLSIRLSGWTPRLVLDGVSLEGAGGELLELRALELDLDPVASLRDRRPSFEALTLVGLHLELHCLANGGIRVSGLDLLKPGEGGVLAGFLEQGRLNLIDADLVLVDDASGRPMFRIEDLRLRLANDGSRHRIMAFARPMPADSRPEPAPAAPARLRLIAELEGPASEPAAWSGTLYTSLQGVDLDALLPTQCHGRELPHAGSALVETWIAVDGGRPSEVLSRVALRGLDLPLAAFGLAREAEGAQGELRVDGLVGTIKGVPDPLGWTLAARDLVVSVGGLELPGLSFDLGLDPSGRPRRLALVAEPFDLAVAQKLLQTSGQPLPGPLERLLAQRPRGRLDGLGLLLELPRQGKPRWRLATRISGLALARSGTLPGVGGLDLEVRADQDGGELDLAADALTLDLVPLFAAPFHLDRLDGRLRWTLEADGTLRIDVDELALHNADLSGHGCLTLILPPAGEGPVIDLRAGFLDGDGAQVRRYLPVGRMPPKLIRWLDRALVDGWAPRARLHVSGPLRRYPFRDGEGLFDLTLEVEDVVLDYREGWPPLRNVDGTLRFVNQAMEIELRSARILDSRVFAGRATLADRKSSPLLMIHARGRGPLADGLFVLAETPLSAKLGPLARMLEVDGDVGLALNLSIPVKPNQKLAVEGRLRLPGSARIGLVGTRVALSDLDGTLGFTDRAISGDGISGRLWGQPVTLSLAPVLEGNGDDDTTSTRISARGRLPVDLLAEEFPSPTWRLADGRVALDLEARLNNADLGRAGVPIAFDLGADLSGLGLDLPAPLGKTRGTRRPLRLGGTVVPGRSVEVSGSLGDLGLALGVDLGAVPAALTHARIELGGGRMPSPVGHQGILITGRLDELVLGHWTDWWQRLAPQLGASTAAVPAIETDLRVGRLGLGALSVEDARIRVASSRLGWVVRVDATELAGRLTVPAADSGGPLDLGLERLDLAALALDAAPADLSTAAPRRRGMRLPAMDLRVYDLRWGEASLGRLDLELRRRGNSVVVPRLAFSGRGETRIDGQTHWSEVADGVDGPGRGRLTLAMESADLGPLLKAMDYANAVREAPVRGQLDISWPGDLAGLSLRQANGTIRFRAGAGRLLEVEPGVGRLLGFFNLGALGRRLSLDFSDLYGEGFAFEHMDGEIALGDGKATLERFEIDGPAGIVRASGSTDLVAGTFDQVVTVEPRIGAGVALAGAVAGGPVVGAAVLLVDKAAGGPFDRLASYRYRVTGPWSQPELSPIGWDPFRGSDADPGADATASGDAVGVASEPPETNHFLDADP